MKNKGLGKNLEIISLMCQFVRLKRGLTQKDVAEEAGISQATVGFLESQVFRKTSAKNITHIFNALCLHKASLQVPSLYELILEDKTNPVYSTLQKKYHKLVDSIVKICSAVFDAYGASLWWKITIEITQKSPFFSKLKAAHTQAIANIEPMQPYPPTDWDKFQRKTEFPDHLSSIIFFDILLQLDKKKLLHVFHIDSLILQAPKGEFEDELLDDFINGDDPFLRLMRTLNIPFVDYFSLIEDIMEITSSLRMAPFEKIEDKFPDLYHMIQAKIYDSSKSAKLLNEYKK